MDKLRERNEVWYIIKSNNHSFRLDTRVIAEKRAKAAKYFVCMSHGCHTVDASGQLSYYTDYKVYDNEFKPVQIKEGDFECTEILNKKSGKVTHIGFEISDQQGDKRSFWFSYSIKAFSECIQYMQEELSKFYSWHEYDLTKLNTELAQLKEENEVLRKQLAKFHDSKNSIKELYQLLFTEATEGN